MGKKRRRDEEEVAEAEGEAPRAPSAEATLEVTGTTGSKKTKQKGVVHVQDLSDSELKDRGVEVEREAELQEELRRARLNQGNLRGDPPVRSSKLAVRGSQSDSE
eukprot:Skav202112  [mRNA]  locus=scaffold1980:121694:124940:+ [translate_table: standard]